MRLYQKSDKPLRIYLEGNQFDITRLLTSLCNKFYQATEYSKEDDIDNIIFQDESNEYYFPVGILAIITAELSRLNIAYDLDIEKSSEVCTIESIPPTLLDGIELREYQLSAIEAALTHKRGLLKVPTGGGKTEIMIGISRYILDNKDGNILICVPTANLLHQTYERLLLRGIPETLISRYGDGCKLHTNRRVCIATVQTVYRRLEDKQFQSWYSDLICLVVDEAHHLACRTWYTMIDRLAPEYNLGVSAEPFYGDKDHMIRDLILRGTVGSILYQIPITYLIEKGYLSKPYMIALDTKYTGNIYGITDWRVVNKSGIIINKSRNNCIKEAAVKLINREKNPLILVQQISHGQQLAKMISEEGYIVAVLTGGLKVAIYSNGVEVDNFKDVEGDTKRRFQEGMIHAMIGTSTMDEGVDVPILSSVILAGGGKSKLKLLQRLGRGLRKKEGSNCTILVDFQDRFNVVTNSQFKKRESSMMTLGVSVRYCSDISKFESYLDTIEAERCAELGLSIGSS